MTDRIERLRERGQEAAQDAAQRGAEAFESARERGTEALGAARERSADAFDAARERGADVLDTALGQAAAVVAKVRPRLRGVMHEYAFFVALVLGTLLVIESSGGRETAAMAIYAVGICGLFGISALYHRHNWQPGARAWMRRLDHSMIFVFMAASVTPFAMLVVHGTTATVMLCVAWGGALGGIPMSLIWTSAPKWVSAVVYISLGLAGALLVPQLWSTLGWLSVAGVALGGVLYITGAVIYAVERPDPWPATFGYHEIFHSLVTAAAGAHYAVIAFAVLPFAH
jgi:hemolysin III